MSKRIDGDRRGIYDSDHFSGAQVSVYIGDIWVDEVTSLSFEVTQNRQPIYGYASTLFDAVAQGNVLVQGSFSINFKEAGYLWLVLNRYKKMIGNRRPPVEEGGTGFVNGKLVSEAEFAQRLNIERIVSDINYDKSRKVRDQKTMAAIYAAQKASNLTGYASGTRGSGGMGGAEDAFEVFENLLWSSGGNPEGNAGDGYNAGKDARRSDSRSLNPFDIYIQYGDYTGDDRIHHTLQKLDSVYILGTSKQIVISGEPVQENYSFIARNLL
jgi:hypothetical protein